MGFSDGELSRTLTAAVSLVPAALWPPSHVALTQSSPIAAAPLLTGATRSGATRRLVRVRPLTRPATQTSPVRELSKTLEATYGAGGAGFAAAKPDDWEEY